MPGAIDKNAVRQRFQRSLETYNRAATVQRDMAGTLLDLFAAATLERQFEMITELGCGAGILTDRIAERFDFAHLTLIDLVPECEAFHRGRANVEFLCGDIETIELPESDLFLSNAVFQWLAEPEQFFGRVAEKLRNGGYLAFTTFGPETLHELSSLTGNGLPYRTAAELVNILESNGLHVIASHEELIVQEFDSPLAALRSLKETGVTAVSAGRPWSRRTLAEFSETYTDRFRLSNGNVPLTYHPIALVAGKKLTT